MAPQLGVLSASTRPTSTQGTVIWSRAYDEVRLGLLRAGLSTTLTASSTADGWAQRVEMLLASGYVLLAKGSVGEKAEATARELIRLGKAELAQLVTDAALRSALIDGGATAQGGGAVSPFIQSQWVTEKDPDFIETAGTGDIPYAYYPPINEGSDL